MHYDTLRAFMTRLEKDGELKRVSVPVSTHLEMTEILTRVIAEDGPAVLFEHPVLPDGTKSNIPVLANLFGTVKRVAMGVTFENKNRETAADLRDVGKVLADMRQPMPPRGMSEAWEMLPMAKAALAMRPKSTSCPPCQHTVLKGDDVDLSALPVMGCWPGEPAPLISWGMVVTKGPGEAREDGFNMGVYRMQVLDKQRAVMRWLAHRGGAMHYARWKETHGDEPMPVAVVIGADPGTLLSAVTPTPETLSEFQYAGLMRGARLELADCVSQPLKVPAEAEIVLEGTVSGPEVEEGPYGDHTGYYNSVEKFPVFTVSAITMRKDPVYLSTYTCRPPDEPSVMGAALNEMFVPLIQLQYPEIVDFWLPPEGCSYRMAVVSMKKAYPGHAKRIMMGVWSFLRQFLYTKWVIIVDEDINVRDWNDVIWAITTRMDPARDITMMENTPIDYLDFASPESGLGSKIGMDATNKMPPEVHRAWGRKIEMDQDIIDKVSEKWASLGLPGAGKSVWGNK